MATKKTGRRKWYWGSSLDDFLKQEGIYDDVVAQVEKEAIARQLQQTAKKWKITEKRVAEPTKTRRGQLDKLLNPKDSNITIKTLHERIRINGTRVLTLKELLRPGLRAIFVGCNPSPRSVGIGHYYQGRHGIRFWSRLREFHITGLLPAGCQDIHAFEQGYGFADLVRRPTASARELTRAEMVAGVDGLIARLNRIGDRPIIVFTYAKPWNLARDRLEQMGYCVLKMPAPYAPQNKVRAEMRRIRNVICGDLITPNSIP